MDTRADIRTLILAKVDRSSRRRIFGHMSRQGGKYRSGAAPYIAQLFQVIRSFFTW